LRERIRYLCRASLLVVAEVGYLPVVPGGNLFFQLADALREGAMILTSNCAFAEWGEFFGDPVVADLSTLPTGTDRHPLPVFGA
jgi:DNA replication protein DnaC